MERRDLCQTVDLNIGFEAGEDLGVNVEFPDGVEGLIFYPTFPIRECSYQDLRRCLQDILFVAGINPVSVDNNPLLGMEIDWIEEDTDRASASIEEYLNQVLDRVFGLTRDNLSPTQQHEMELLLNDYFPIRKKAVFMSEEDLASLIRQGLELNEQEIDWSSA